MNFGSKWQRKRKRVVKSAPLSGTRRGNLIGMSSQIIRNGKITFATDRGGIAVGSYAMTELGDSTPFDVWHYDRHYIVKGPGILTITPDELQFDGKSMKPHLG